MIKTGPASPWKNTSSKNSLRGAFLITIKTSRCATLSLPLTRPALRNICTLLDIVLKQTDVGIQCIPSQTKPEQYCSSSMYFKFDMQRGQCATGPCMSVRHQQKFHASSLFTHIIYIYIIHCNQLPAFICLKSKTKKHPKPSKPVPYVLKLGLTKPWSLFFGRPFSKVLKFYSSILPTLPPPQPISQRVSGVVRSHTCGYCRGCTR